MHRLDRSSAALAYFDPDYVGLGVSTRRGSEGATSAGCGYGLTRLTRQRGAERSCCRNLTPAEAVAWVGRATGRDDFAMSHAELGMVHREALRAPRAPGGGHCEAPLNL